MKKNEFSFDPENPEITNNFYKLILLGDSGVGKTTIIKNYLFPLSSIPVQKTENPVQPYMVKYSMKNQQQISFIITDTNGSKDQQSYLNTKYLPNIKPDIIFYIYSIDDQYSFISLKGRIQELEKCSEIQPQIKVIFGNKLDKIEQMPLQRAVSHEKGQKFAQNIGALFYEVNAFDKYKLETIMQEIFQILATNESTKITQPNKKSKGKLNVFEGQKTQQKCQCSLY